MKSLHYATVLVAALGVTAPAMAAEMAMHHHHAKKAGMMQPKTSDDEQTAKLNEQSLQNAKSGAPMAPAAPPATAEPAAAAMPMPATGTGIAAPSSGAMGHSLPNAPPAIVPPK